MSRTKDEWYDLIRNDLGQHHAFVPLEEPDLDAALSDASDIWRKYLPVVKYGSVNIPSGLTMLDFSDDEDVDGIGSYRFTDSTVDVSRTLTPFYPIQIMSMSLQGPRFQFEVNTTIERWARLLGGKEDVKWYPPERQLYVWNPRGQTYFTYQMMCEVGLEDVEPHRYSLFRKLFRAKARNQMIQIFQRLGPLPGPDGNIETDMDQQQQAHDKELEDVIPILERMAMSVPRWD